MDARISYTDCALLSDVCHMTLRVLLILTSYLNKSNNLLWLWK